MTCAQRGRRADRQACVGVMGVGKGLALGTILIHPCLSPGGILKRLDCGPGPHPLESEPSRNGDDSSVKTLPWRLVGRWSSCGTPSSVWGLNLFPFLCDTAAKYGDFKSLQESQNLLFLMFSNGEHSLCECSGQDLCSGGTWGQRHPAVGMPWGCFGGMLSHRGRDWQWMVTPGCSGERGGQVAVLVVVGQHRSGLGTTVCAEMLLLSYRIHGNSTLGREGGSQRRVFTIVCRGTGAGIPHLPQVFREPQILSEEWRNTAQRNANAPAASHVTEGRAWAGIPSASSHSLLLLD